MEKDSGLFVSVLSYHNSDKWLPPGKQITFAQGDAGSSAELLVINTGAGIGYHSIIVMVIVIEIDPHSLCVDSVNSSHCFASSASFYRTVPKIAQAVQCKQSTV